MWLYIGGLTYCDEFTTDGRIPVAALKGLTTTEHNYKKDADLLVKAGLWSKEGDHYVVERYLEKNRSAADIQAQREKASLAGRVSAAKRLVQPPVQRPVNETLNGSPTPTPTEEEVEREKRKTLKASPLPAEVGSAHFEDFWAEYPAQPNGSKPEKKKAHDQWVKLTDLQRQRALTALPHYRRHLIQLDRSAKYAERYLRDRTFEDFQSAPLELVNGSVPTPPVDWAKVQQESQERAEKLAGLA